MIANLVLGIICLLILFSIKDKENGLKWVFVIVTAFLAVRYDWGNDYAEYLQSFKTYNSYGFDLFDIEKSRDIRSHSEFGWVILNRIFGLFGLGFFGLVIALTVFESWVLYRFVKKYLDSQYYWVAILFWIFSTSFCIDASMMRQYLCICLYFFVIDLMIEKKVKGFWLWSIAIILLGSTIHKSFIFTLISLPLFYIQIKQSRITIILMIAIIILFIVWNKFGARIIEPIMTNVLNEQEDLSGYLYYVGRDKNNSVSTGLGVIFHYILFAVWLLLLPNLEKKDQSLVVLIIAGYFFGVITSIAPLAGRLSLYFNAVSMITWGYLFSKSKRWPLLYAVFVVELAILVREFIGFFYDPIWINKCMYYHTIFEASSWM